MNEFFIYFRGNSVKRFVTAILMISFFCQVNYQAIMVGSYYADTASFAKNCINKTKPQLHCNGRCQMVKKLKAEEKKEQQEPNRITKIEVLSSKSFFAALPLRHGSFLQHCMLCNPGTPIDRPAAIFHPPPISFFI